MRHSTSRGPWFIGIAGGSGSGKTSICDYFKTRYPRTIGVLQVDDFYRTLRAIPSHQGVKNYDHPNGIDSEKLFTVLKKIRLGRPSSFISYQQKNDGGKTVVIKRRLHLPRRKIYLIEGFSLLHYRIVRPLLDLSFFIQASQSQRLARRNKPHNEKQYLRDVMLPMYRKYVWPSRRYASMIITVGSQSTNIVANKIRSAINLRLKTDL